MPLKFECLELRNLLAADVSVMFDSVTESAAGQEATRTIRVFSDEAADVEVRSILSVELESATWERFEGRGLQRSPVLSENGGVADYQIDAQFVEEIGDFNGDGNNDFLFRFDDNSHTIIYGDLSDGIKPENIGPKIVGAKSGPVEVHSVGDLNGDGFSDLSYELPSPAIARAILFGSDQIASNQAIDVTAAAPTAHTAILSGMSGDGLKAFPVGDLNGDGLADMVVGEATDTWVSSSPSERFVVEGRMLWGNTELSPGQAIDANTLPTTGAIDAKLTDLAQVRPVGDFNNDGFEDAVFVKQTGSVGRNSPPLLLYGASDPSELQTVSLDGFNTINATLSTDRWLGSAFFVSGGGDVNGDGISDIVFSFNMGDHQQPSSSRVIGTGGMVVVYGGTSADGVYVPDDTQNTNFVFNEELYSSNESYFGFVEDINDDGLADLRYRRNHHTVILGSSELPGQQIEPSDINGETIYELSGDFHVADLNADGFSDVISGGQVLLGEVAPSAVASGTGDINEVVQIDANRSVYYRVTGVVKSDAEQISTSAIPSGQQDSDLHNNVISDKEVTLLDLQIAEPQQTGDEVLVEIRVSNNGLSPARGVVVGESITASLLNANATREFETFPDEISLRSLPSGLGATFEGPMKDSFFDVVNFDPFFESLGRDVGSVGDVNNDGFDDFFIQDLSQRWLVNGAADYPDGRLPVPVATDVEPQDEQSGFDFNGDGFEDATAMGFDSELDLHFVDVLFGNAAGEFPDPATLDGTNGLTIFGRLWLEGDSVFGDLNGDGLDDLVVSGEQDEAFVVYGSEGNDSDRILLADLESDQGFRIKSDPSSSPFFSYLSLASNLDVNGDGLDDLLIGDPNVGPFFGIGGQPHGAAYVIYGRSAEATQLEGPISDTIDVPPGTTVVYSIRGTLPEGSVANGTVDVTVSPTQFDMLGQTRQESIGVGSQLLGDVDGNGDVSFVDFLILSKNFGSENALQTDGDLNGDARVTFDDFLILLNNFGMQDVNQIEN